MFEFLKRKAPETNQNKQVSEQKAIDSPFLSYMHSSTDDISLASNYYALARYGYVVNPIARRCIDRAAEAQSSIPYRLKKKLKDSTEEIKQHPVVSLFDRPNPLYSWPELIQEFFVDKLIAGEAFLLATIDPRNGQPAEIWPIKPNEITVEYDATVNGIIYTVTSKNAKYKALSSENFKCQIFHFKDNNPLNKWRGISPLISAGNSIESINDGLRWNKNLVKNGANPTGAFSSKDSLTTQQYERLKQEIDLNFTGASNAGKPLLLEGGLEYNSISMSPKDMDFINNLKQNSRMICTVYGTPPQLVGVEGESTYSNYGEALIAYWQDTIIPECNLFYEALNRWILDFYKDGTDLYFEPVYDNIAALEMRRKALFDRAIAAQTAGILSIDESRELVGYAAKNVTNSDSLLVPAGKTPLELVGEDIGTQAEDDYAAAIDEVGNTGGKETPAEDANEDPNEEEQNEDEEGNQGGDSNEG